jgi:hypothetical protein
VRHRLTFGCGLLLASSLLTLTVNALEVSGQGNAVYLSGPINLGSHAKFEAFMMANRDKGYKIVHLNSPGGWTGDMREIARDIRRAGLSTAVDGGRAVCASACTVLFAAGVQRYYYNAERVKEGLGKADLTPGLGYHGANNSRQNSVMSNQSPGAGTAQVISLYYEFGSSQASTLVTKADPHELYRISGATALAMGIATSISRP